MRAELTKLQLDFIAFIEQWYYQTSDRTLPDTQFVTIELGIPEKTVKELYNTPAVGVALARRGIDIFEHISSLSPAQLTACNLALSTGNTDTFKRKLDRAGILPSQWDAWKRLPKVQKYLRQRSEAGLDDAIATAQVALVKNAEAGDFKSIQYLMEITGRFSNKTVGDLNIEFFLGRLLEIIQKHIKDPAALEAIGSELLELAPSYQFQQARQVEL